MQFSQSRFRHVSTFVHAIAAFCFGPKAVLCIGFFHSTDFFRFVLLLSFSAFRKYIRSSRSVTNCDYSRMKISLPLPLEIGCGRERERERRFRSVTQTEFEHFIAKCLPFQIH